MWVINQSKTLQYKVDLTNSVENMCANSAEPLVQDRVLAKPKGLSKHSDKSQMWSQLFMLSILLMSPRLLVGFLLGVFFLPPLPQIQSKLVWCLVPGTAACFLSTTVRLSEKQNNIFEMGCLYGQHSATAVNVVSPSKRLQSTAHLMKVLTVFGWLDLHGSSQLISWAEPKEVNAMHMQMFS